MKRTLISLLALGTLGAAAALVYAQQATTLPGPHLEGGAVPARLHRELAEWRELVGCGDNRDAVLRRLQRQLAELTNLLVLEKGQGKKAQDELAALQATLATLKADNERLTKLAAAKR